MGGRLLAAGLVPASAIKAYQAFVAQHGTVQVVIVLQAALHCVLVLKAALHCIATQPAVHLITLHACSSRNRYV